jgi:hypothetical protein
MANHTLLKIWLTRGVATGCTALACYATAAYFGDASLTFAWVLNFLLMPWFTLLVNQRKPTFSARYFLTKPFENEGRIYRYAGVHIYRKLLVWIGWEKIMRQGNTIQANTAALQTLEYNTRVSETGHAIIFLIVLAVTVITFENIDQAKWLILTNVLLNVYPVLLQRFNRPRYLRILKHFK